MATITDDTGSNAVFYDEHSFQYWEDSNDELFVDDDGEYIVFSLEDRATVIDDTDDGGWVFDGILTAYEDSNINVFPLASLPLNDIVPYDIIDYGTGITDESGTATNITDD